MSIVGRVRSFKLIRSSCSMDSRLLVNDITSPKVANIVHRYVQDITIRFLGSGIRSLIVRCVEKRPFALFTHNHRKLKESARRSLCV